MNLVLITQEDRASSYGIGTYIDTLCEVFAHDSKIRLLLVKLYSHKPSITVSSSSSKAKTLCIEIPKPAKSVISIQNYAVRVSYIISTRIYNGLSTIFLFNHFTHIEFAKVFKQQFPSCRILFSIHYFYWCFRLMGNRTKFRDLISNKFCDTPSDIKYNYTLEREFMMLSDTIIALSNYAKMTAITDYGINESKIVVIPNGVTNKSHMGIRPRWMSTSTRYIIYSSRLDEIKGFKHVASAMNKIVAEYSDITLIVAGDGDFNAAFSLIKDFPNRVIFLGKIHRNDLLTLYKYAYIGIQPSYHEQSSFSLIEMIANELPVIGMDSTGLSEVLESVPELLIPSPESGYSISEIDNILALKIKYLLDNPKELSRIKKKVYQIYNNRFSLYTMHKAYRNLISCS